MSALLEVRAVTQRFGGLLALDAVSTTVESGEIHGLIGPNGAGKSTLLNVLTGLYRPQGGEVLLEGTSLTRLRPDVIYHRGVTRTFQNARIWPEMTLLESVMVAAYAAAKIRPWDAFLRPGRAGHLMRRLREAGLAALDLFGLAGHAGTLAGSLSYGQRRLLEMARACVAQPRLLLLDEPVAGLNPIEVSDLARRIRALRGQGMTVLLVEQNAYLALEVAHRGYVLENGRVVYGDAASALLESDSIRASYLGH